MTMRQEVVQENCTSRRDGGFILIRNAFIDQRYISTMIDKLENEHWGTEPSMLAPGVHVSRTLMPNDRMDDIPIWVFNVLSKPVVIERGCVIADFQPTFVIGNLND
jgi:hypothetical protein